MTQLNILANTGIACFILHKGSVLIIHRDANPLIENPGKYALLSGSYDFKDGCPAITAEREINEELGLAILAHRIVFLGRELIPCKSKLSYLFALELDEHEVKRIRLTEGQSCRFASFEDIASLHTQGKLGGFLHRLLDRGPGYVRMIMSRQLKIWHTLHLHTRQLAA